MTSVNYFDSNIVSYPKFVQTVNLYPFSRVQYVLQKYISQCITQLLVYSTLNMIR